MQYSFDNSGNIHSIIPAIFIRKFRQYSFDNSYRAGAPRMMYSFTWPASIQNADWESLELCLLNFLEKCEIDSEEITYPIVANLFNCTEMALSVILAMADAADDDRQPFFRDLGECFREIYRCWWQELSKIESWTTSAVDLGTPCRKKAHAAGGHPLISHHLFWRN